MNLVLGIDLGTSYFKLGLFDRTGRQRGLGRTAVETDKGDGPLREVPADRFWSTLREGVDQALTQSGARGDDVAAVAYSSQANSFLLLDEAATPVTPLVLWTDERVVTPPPAVREVWGREDFLDVTGLGIAAGGSAAVAKLLWLADHRPDQWSRRRFIMTISDYLVFSLTGLRVGDAGTASLLGVWNQHEQAWWDEALRTLRIDRSQLSAPLRPGTVAGELTVEGARRLGLKAGVPVVVGSLDHHVAAIGAGGGTVAPCSESTGTALACLKIAEQYAPKVNCCTGPAVDPQQVFQLAFSKNGAEALEWYQRRHRPELSIPELVDLAREVPIGCEGLVAEPEAGRYEALDGFKNRSGRHGHGHFVRAIMESTTASLGHLVDSLFPAGRPERIVATGGGARSDFWLQMKADALGIEFVRPECGEPACMGAAMLAAVAADWFCDVHAVSEAWVKPSAVFAPRPAQHRQYADWLPFLPADGS